jgi:hypothetical protein
VGTIEDHLLEILETKINLFRLVVGEIDGILGKLRLDERVAKMCLEARNDAELKRRMEELGDELAAMRTKYERCKTDNTHVLDGLTPDLVA